MVSDILGIFTLALVLTFLGLAIRDGAQTSQILNAGLNGFAKIQNTVAQG